MSMWALAFGGVATCVLALNASVWRRNTANIDALGISFMLLVVWFISNATLALYGVPDVVRLYPLWDLIGGVLVAVSFSRHPSIWKGVVLGCFFAMMAAHVAVRARYLSGSGSASFYLKALDVLVLVQLAAAAWPGARHVAVHLFSGLRGVPDPRLRMGD